MALACPCCCPCRCYFCCCWAKLCSIYNVIAGRGIHAWCSRLNIFKILGHFCALALVKWVARNPRCCQQLSPLETFVKVATTIILMAGTIRIYTCSVPHCGRRNILPLRGRNIFLANACLDISKTQLSRFIPYRHRIEWRPDGGRDIFDVGLFLKGAILA